MDRVLVVQDADHRPDLTPSLHLARRQARGLAELTVEPQRECQFLQHPKDGTDAVRPVDLAHRVLEHQQQKKDLKNVDTRLPEGGVCEDDPLHDLRKKPAILLPGGKREAESII